MPSADDYADFLKRVKEAEEVGLTPAEVWRAEEPCIHDWRYRNSDGMRYCLDCGAEEPTADGAPVCTRCKRPTEYQARLCYDCENAMFGGE